MEVNEDRDESEEEQEGGYGNEEAEEVSTLEGMGYVLDNLEYEVDVSEDLERIGLDSRRYWDDIGTLGLEGDKDDVLASGVYDLKGCEMMDRGDSDYLDVDTSVYF